MKAVNDLLKGNSKNILLIFFLFISFGNTSLDAQQRFGVNFSPAWDYPVNKFNSNKLDNGFGFGVDINYNLFNYFSVYGGWDWNKFSADQSFAGPDIYLLETGYIMGLNFIHPINDTKLNYLVGAGATYKHIEIETKEGDEVVNSDFGFGWEANLGLQFKIARRWNMTPSLRFRSTSRSFTLNDAKYDDELNYISLKVVVGWMF